MIVRLDHFVKGGERQLRAQGMIAPHSVQMVRHPEGSAQPVVYLEVAISENAAIHWRL